MKRVRRMLSAGVALILILSAMPFTLAASLETPFMTPPAFSAGEGWGIATDGFMSASPTMTLSVNAQAVEVGTQLTLSARISDLDVIPKGNVTFFANEKQIGSAYFINGISILTWRPSVVGDYSLMVQYTPLEDDIPALRAVNSVKVIGVTPRQSLESTDTPESHEVREAEQIPPAANQSQGTDTSEEQPDDITREVLERALGGIFSVSDTASDTTSDESAGDEKVPGYQRSDDLSPGEASSPENQLTHDDIHNDGQNYEDTAGRQEEGTFLAMDTTESNNGVVFTEEVSGKSVENRLTLSLRLDPTSPKPNELTGLSAILSGEGFSGNGWVLFTVDGGAINMVPVADGAAHTNWTPAKAGNYVATAAYLPADDERYVGILDDTVTISVQEESAEQMPPENGDPRGSGVGDTGAPADQADVNGPQDARTMPVIRAAFSNNGEFVAGEAFSMRITVEGGETVPQGEIIVVAGNSTQALGLSEGRVQTGLFAAPSAEEIIVSVEYSGNETYLPATFGPRTYTVVTDDANQQEGGLTPENEVTASLPDEPGDESGERLPAMEGDETVTENQLTLSLEADPQSPTPNTPVTLSATLRCEGAAFGGGVLFAVDGTTVGFSPAMGGAAQATWTPKVTGEYAISATYVPIAQERFAGNLDAAITVSVTGEAGGDGDAGADIADDDEGDDAPVNDAGSTEPFDENMEEEREKLTPEIVVTYSNGGAFVTGEPFIARVEVIGAQGVPEGTVNLSIGEGIFKTFPLADGSAQSEELMILGEASFAVIVDYSGDEAYAAKRVGPEIYHTSSISQEHAYEETSQTMDDLDDKKITPEVYVSYSNSGLFELDTIYAIHVQVRGEMQQPEGSIVISAGNNAVQTCTLTNGEALAEGFVVEDMQDFAIQVVYSGDATYASVQYGPVIRKVETALEEEVHEMPDAPKTESEADDMQIMINGEHVENITIQAEDEASQSLQLMVKRGSEVIGTEALDWASSSPLSAVVDEHGRLICRDAGTSLITATDETGLTASVTVTITQALQMSELLTTPLLQSSMEPWIVPEVSTVNFPVEGGVQYVNVKSSVDWIPWTPGYGITYVEVTKVSDTVLKISKGPSNSTAPYAFTYYLRPVDGDWFNHFSSVTITQDPLEPYLTVQPDGLSFDAISNQGQLFIVESDGITDIKAYDPWVTAVQQFKYSFVPGGQILKEYVYVTVDDNLGADTRYGEILISTKSIQSTIPVRQAGGIEPLQIASVDRGNMTKPGKMTDNQGYVGDTMYWQVAATGGSGNYNYKFVVYDFLFGKILRDTNFIPNSRFEYQTSASGKYGISITVQDVVTHEEVSAGGNLVYMIGIIDKMAIEGYIKTSDDACVGDTIRFELPSVSGGYGQKTYTAQLWGPSGIIYTKAVAEAVTHTATAAGSYFVIYTVTDNDGNKVQGTSRKINVYSVPVVTQISPNKQNAVVGEAIVWEYAIEGGRSPYQVKLYVINGPDTNVKTLEGQFGGTTYSKGVHNHTLQNEGVTILVIEVTDANGMIKKYLGGHVSVSRAALRISSITPSVESAAVGDSIGWTATINGGNGSYIITADVLYNNVYLADYNRIETNSNTINFQAFPSPYEGIYALKISVQSGDGQALSETSGELYVGRSAETMQIGNSFVETALLQEGKTDGTLFGAGKGQAWCAYFTIWAAKQHGILNTRIPDAPYCENGIAWYISKNRWANAQSGYTPQRGDLIYILWNGRQRWKRANPSGPEVADHVGIVTGCDGKYVYTIEGNTSGRVGKRSYPLEDNRILGYGKFGQ